jgi:tRNA pseudouridine38-40 synthase
MRHAIEVYYDGRGFHGSQIQPDRRTVEGELLRALREFGISPGDFQGAARTDRGVSALANVYAFSSPRRPVPKAINSFLPPDVRVLGSAVVDDGFHPRREAKEKIYRYFLFNKGYDLGKMRRAAGIYRGVHSFHNYCRRDARETVRRLRSIELERNGEVLVITFIGESFLWEMVRRLVTALRRAGKGEVSIEELRESLMEGVEMVFPPSPPEGLVLWRVVYDFSFMEEEYSRKRLMEALIERIEGGKVLTAVDEAIYRELETR